MSTQSGNRFSHHAQMPLSKKAEPTECLITGGRFRRRRRLPPVAEEVFEQRGGFKFPDAAIDLGPRMAGWSRQESYAALDRAALRIGGAIVEPPDACKRDRGRTHRT